MAQRKEEQKEEQYRRIRDSLDKIEGLKDEIKKCNEQLQDELELADRNMDFYLSSGILTMKECESILINKEQLKKFSLEQEYEYESYIRNLNQQRDKQEEEFRKLSSSREDNRDSYENS